LELPQHREDVVLNVATPKPIGVPRTDCRDPSFSDVLNEFSQRRPALDRQLP
jgi:hypothetical protein